MPATTRSKKQVSKRPLQSKKKKEELPSLKKKPLDVYLLSEAVTCTVCKLFLRRPVQLRPCAHVFCNSCISKWLMRKHTCPCCRAKPEKLVNDLSFDFILSKFRDCASSNLRDTLECDREGITCELVTCEEISLEHLVEKFERLFHHVYRTQQRSSSASFWGLLDNEELPRGSSWRRTIGDVQDIRNTTNTLTSDSTNTGESTGDETQIMSHPNPTLELRSNEEPSPTLEELITSFPPPVFGGRPSAFRSVNVSTNSTDQRNESSTSESNFEFEGVSIATGDVPDFPRVVILAALGSQNARSQSRNSSTRRTATVLSRTPIFM